MNRSRRTQLALGTVQFGLSYGVTNTRGKVPPEEVQKILRLAGELGIQTLDTAHGYGESEQVLGAAFPLLPHSFRIVSKTKSLKGQDLQEVETGLRLSLQRLGRPSLYGLLVHHPEDLLESKGPELFSLLLRWKEEGLVEKIGASVYTGQEIDAILEKFPIDLIQLPLNVLDQRLLRGNQLQRLGALNVEVHARSLFLQGILLMPPERLPDPFRGIHPLLKEYRQTLERNDLTPLEGALAFVQQLGLVDSGVVGVCSEGELREIGAAWEKARSAKLDFSAFAVHDPAIVNPALWKK